MSPRGDDDLGPLFEKARRRDEKGAPSFRRVLDRVRAPHAAPLRIGRAAAAAFALVVLAISLKIGLRARETRPNRIEAWKPPTDFLLEASFTELFDTTPLMPDAVPDYAPLLAREKQKENEKGKKS